MNLRILFLHANCPDYVGDSLFHGLRSLLGDQIVEVPRMDYMYNDYDKKNWQGIANEGKILYGHLDDNIDLQNARSKWSGELQKFDRIIISNPTSFGNGFDSIIKHIRKSKCDDKLVWVDGSDTPAVFPFVNIKKALRQKPFSFFLPMKRWPYFKRENNGVKNMAPGLLYFFTKKYKIYPINISIPKEHIERIGIAFKTKQFPDYIVDPEIAENQHKRFGAVGRRAFVFNSEETYLEDVRKSKYGITTKRAGWDCLRHYEYASKGAVLCFKNLEEKVPECAPFGLNKNNCISYSDYSDLNRKISSQSQEEYTSMQEASYEWVSSQNTIAVAEKFLETIQSI